MPRVTPNNKNTSFQEAGGIQYDYSSVGQGIDLHPDSETHRLVLEDLMLAISLRLLHSVTPPFFYSKVILFSGLNNTYASL